MGQPLHERSDLITGGAGSVGRSLVARCRADGHTVRVFDLPVCDFTGLEGEPGIEVVQGTSRRWPLSRRRCRVSAVMHLAAILPPASERNRERTLAINVDGTNINLMEANAREAVLVFSSSSAPMVIRPRKHRQYGWNIPNRPGYLRREQDRQ